MTITPHLLQNESPVEELALLMVGEPKAGKSYMAATSPGTILFLDFDKRLNALRSHPNVKNIYGLSFADPTDTNLMPVAMNECFSVLSAIEKSPFLNDIHGSFAGIDKPIDTLVYDSVQTMAIAARNYILYNAGDSDGVARKFAIGGRVYRVPKSYTAWGSEMEMVTSAILQGRAFLHCRKCWKSVTSRKNPQGIEEVIHTDPKITDHKPEPKAMNIIVTLHEAPEEDPRSTDDNPMYTGRVVVYPIRYRTLLVYFNEVWRLIRTNGRVPTVQYDPNGVFIQAATALGLDPGVAFKPDIKTILNDAKSMRKA